MVLEDKKRLLELAISAISAAEGTPGLKRIIEVIEMQNNADEWTQKYDALIKGKIEHLQAMSPETRAALRKAWNDLLEEVKGALHEDPSSLVAQALGERWLKLLVVTCGGVDPLIAKHFGAAYRPDQGWQAAMKGYGDERLWDFMGKVLAVRA